MIDKISIIVPVFNGEDYIERCAKSILEQSYDNIELILVDDGSEDKSLELCHKIAEKDNRVIVLAQPNRGVSAARNRGLNIATGEFVTFVDVDDCLMPDMLTIVNGYMKEYSADVVIYGWSRYRETGCQVEMINQEFEIILDSQVVIKRILEHYSACGGGYPWNKMWRRSQIKNMQFFNEELFYFEDLEWVIRMLLQVKRVVICPECLYRYSIHFGSVSTDLSRAEDKELSYHMALRSVIDTLRVAPELQYWLREKYAPEIVNGVVHAKRNNWRKLEMFLREELRDRKQMILKSSSISIRVKWRCFRLSLFS